MRTGNPSLRRIFRQSQTGEIHVESQPATYWGIAKKAMLFGGITILSAIAVLVALNFAFYGNNPEVLTVVLIGVLCGALPMIIISLVITFVPKTVKFLGPVYALFQGATLGMLVFGVDLVYPGIALAAVLGTLIVFVLCVALNKLLEVRISGKVMRIALISFVSLVVLELGLFVASLFVTELNGLFTQAYLWIQLAISAVCIIYATILLMWDLQTADAIVQSGADKKHEWMVAFSIVVTLVYLYVEILELLLRLLAIFGRRGN